MYHKVNKVMNGIRRCWLGMLAVVVSLLATSLLSQPIMAEEGGCIHGESASISSTAAKAARAGDMAGGWLPLPNAS